jgi:DNA-binding CsgD family transcriptional regulator
MPEPEQLRPVERRVLRLAAAGVDDEEIARRFKRSPAWAAQVRRLAGIERPGSAAPATRTRSHALRPLERRVLRWREGGVDHVELSARFRRSPEFLERVEEYAQFKLAVR